MTKIKTPSMLYRYFFAMKLRAAQLRLLGRRVIVPFDPLRKERESVRRENRRWGGGGDWIRGTGKRQGERIARQIAKGQLREENGLQRSR